MKIIWKILANLVALALVDALFAGVSISTNSIIVLSIVLTFANMYIKPVIKFISLPINILTLGIFSLFINAIIVHISFSLVSGARVSSFITSIIVAFCLSIINGFIGKKEK